jgi:hypothetical protein
MNETLGTQQAVVRFLVMPILFLTVALLGGLRVDASHAFVMVPPPLVTLVLAVLLARLFARARLVRLECWLGAGQPGLTVLSHLLTLLALYFATAQAFNSVLPERGLLHWLFVFFFFWTLWNDQFSPFDARRLLRSVGVLFGTAFLLKHLLLAGLHTPEAGWSRRLLGAVLEGVSLGSLEQPAFAPATGYLSFFTLAMYVIGLALLPSSPQPAGSEALVPVGSAAVVQVPEGEQSGGTRSGPSA